MIPFLVAATVAVVATLLVITRRNAVHALLYLVVSLLAVAVVFLLLGATFVAALEVIVYAGAIIVLLLFVVMLLNLGPAAEEQERRWLAPGAWLGPSLLALVLATEVGWLVLRTTSPASARAVGPREVGMALFGPYLVGVELASFLLLAALVAAYHLGERARPGGEGRR